MSKIRDARARILEKQKESALAPATQQPAGPATKIGVAQQHAARRRKEQASAPERKRPAQTRLEARVPAQEAEARLLEAVDSLHGLKLEDKLARKRALIEEFRPEAEALLGAGGRNDAFCWWIVWLFDVGLIEEFIPKSRRAVEVGWKSPLNRDLETFLWDAVLEWSDVEFRAGRSPEPYFGQAYAETARMIEVVQGKYHKLAGDLARKDAERAEDPEQQKQGFALALERYEAAEAAYPKAGVKTRIDEVTKALERLKPT